MSADNIGGTCKYITFSDDPKKKKREILAVP